MNIGIFKRKKEINNSKEDGDSFMTNDNLYEEVYQSILAAIKRNCGKDWLKDYTAYILNGKGVRQAAIMADVVNSLVKSGD